jgi:hypothetical protein
MNPTRLKCFLVMTVLALIGFGPLSLTCLLGMIIVITRPRWFYSVVENLYRGADPGTIAGTATQSAKTLRTSGVRLRCFLALLVLLVLDIAPVPVTGSIGLYVIWQRPSWFKSLVENVYADLCRIP